MRVRHGEFLLWMVSKLFSDDRQAVKPDTGGTAIVEISGGFRSF